VWLVVMASIRQKTGVPVMAALFDSLTVPTDVVVVTGRGHAQAINHAMRALDPARHQFVTRMDDDVVLARGWQDEVQRTFEDVTSVGMLGLDMSHTPLGHDYMVVGMPRGEMIPATTVRGTRLRFVDTGNVGGACVSYRTEDRLAAGDIPTGGVDFQIYADAVIGERIKRTGKWCAYLVTDAPLATMVAYDDPAAYTQWKAEQAAETTPQHGRLLSS
jgi:hypothetical protein